MVVLPAWSSSTLHGFEKKGLGDERDSQWLSTEC